MTDNNIYSEVSDVLSEIVTLILNTTIDNKDIPKFLDIINANDKQNLTLQTKYIENGFINIIRLTLEGMLSVRSASTITINENKIDDLLLSIVNSRKSPKINTKKQIFRIVHTFLLIVNPENADKKIIRNRMREYNKLFYKKEHTINELKEFYNGILEWSFHFLYLMYNGDYEIVIHKLVKDFDKTYKGIYDAKKHGSNRKK